ncbi:MAG: homoserine kinase, partial [Mycobacteriales bacterium]
HLVVKAARAAFARLGGAPRGLQVVCANRIPQTRGLGSSAAAIVAGILAARALIVGGSERLDDAAVFGLATSLEGHPDNVAACLAGGFTISWLAECEPRRVALKVHPSLAPVLFVPPNRVSTAKVRRLLPSQVPHADATRNTARAALMVEAITHRPELLLDASEDWLHQSYRAPAMARSAALVAKLRAAGIPAVVSGAGPSVLALTTAEVRPAATRLAGQRFQALEPAVDSDGAKVLGLGNLAE